MPGHGQCVAAVLQLHGDLEKAAKEDDSEDGEARLGSEGGGGDQFAGADNRGRKNQTGTQVLD